MAELPLHAPTLALEALFAPSTLLDTGWVLLATALAAWLRPWRMLGPEGPPLTWMLAWLTLPLAWSAAAGDAFGLMPTWSGAVLLVLLAGWPLAVLSMLPAALVVVLSGLGHWPEAIHGALWAGVLPATLALAIGAVVRRCWPHKLFGYLLGRAFFGTLLSLMGASLVALWFAPPMLGLSWPELATARLLMSFAEAAVTGLVAALLVALKPGWLATYSERWYAEP